MGFLICKNVLKTQSLCVIEVLLKHADKPNTATLTQPMAHQGNLLEKNFWFQICLVKYFSHVLQLQFYSYSTI